MKFVRSGFVGFAMYIGLGAGFAQIPVQTPGITTGTIPVSSGCTGTPAVCQIQDSNPAIKQSGTTTTIAGTVVAGGTEIDTTTPWVDVRAYGATGTGCTGTGYHDDSPYILLAVAALPNGSVPGTNDAYNKKGRVYFPPGTYCISSGIILPSGPIYQGDSFYGSTIELAPGAAVTGSEQFVVTIDTAAAGANATFGTQIRDLTIDGGGGTLNPLSSGLYMVGAQGTGTSNIAVQRVGLRNLFYAGGGALIMNGNTILGSALHGPGLDIQGQVVADYLNVGNINPSGMYTDADGDPIAAINYQTSSSAFGQGLTVTQVFAENNAVVAKVKNVKGSPLAIHNLYATSPAHAGGAAVIAGTATSGVKIDHYDLQGVSPNVYTKAIDDRTNSIIVYTSYSGISDFLSSYDQTLAALGTSGAILATSGAGTTTAATASQATSLIGSASATSFGVAKCDGTSITCSSGVFSTAAGASLSSWVVNNGVRAAGTTFFVQNQTRVSSFDLPVSLTVTKLRYAIATADNSANLYNVEILNASMTTVTNCAIGPTAGTSFAPAVGSNVASFTGTCVLLPGHYYIATTTNALTPAVMYGVQNFAALQNATPTTGSATSGAVFASPIVAAEVWNSANPAPLFALSN